MAKVGQPWRILEDGSDLYCLAHAVSFAETSSCKKGTAKYHNCHGIMFSGKPAVFTNKDESFTYFYKLWSENYKKYPDYNLAVKYTGNDNAKTWLGAVNQYYNECIKNK